VSLDIPFEPGTVWDELEQLEQHITWMAEAEALTFVGAQRRGVGTEIVVVTKVGPFRTRDHLRFTQWSVPIPLVPRSKPRCTCRPTDPAADLGRQSAAAQRPTQLPVKSGSRFSRKAETPSTASCVPNTWRKPAASMPSPSSIGLPTPSLIACFASPSAVVGPAA